MPEYIMVFIIKNAIANCYEINKEKKKREKLRDKREQESIAITWLTEKDAKTLRSVAEFLCGAEWINETAPKWTYKRKVWEKSSNYGLWNVARVWVFLKIVVIVVQSGLKLYNLTVMAAGVQMKEFVIASVRTTLTTEPSCVCLIELKTELIIKLER